ncbi:MAG: NAD kinase [Chitinophagia bacterium]|jgi:NAD+ kinase|nr:NAD kinase [Chitinophagia bacterium]
MKVAIYSRGVDLDQQQSLNALLLELHRYDITICIFHDLMQKFNLSAPAGKQAYIPFLSAYDLPSNIDCLISLGGDGTVLDSVTLVGDSNIPILGINYGRLGFLASISKDELSTMVDALVSGTFVIEKRALIHLDANMPIFGTTPFGLNEFVIHKRDISPMIKIHTYLNGEFLNSYWADGIIVSTPTGSTGYNMSCNGPILFPDSASFVITPVAPHNLNVRSIVVPNTSVISFEIEGRTEELLCALDARKEIVPKSIQLALKQESFTVSFIRLNENSYLTTLRTKLTWGLDKRN